MANSNSVQAQRETQHNRTSQSLYSWSGGQPRLTNRQNQNSGNSGSTSAEQSQCPHHSGERSQSQKNGLMNKRFSEHLRSPKEGRQGYFCNLYNCRQGKFFVAICGPDLFCMCTGGFLGGFSQGIQEQFSMHDIRMKEFHDLKGIYDSHSTKAKSRS